MLFVINVALLSNLFISFSLWVARSDLPDLITLQYNWQANENPDGMKYATKDTDRRHTGYVDGIFYPSYKNKNLITCFVMTFVLCVTVI